jgi:polysaccharide pyruvyl transferase WcaK-like protein
MRRLAWTTALIVPGTQILSDNLTGPFGWVYEAFKWSVCGKLCRCKLLFVSIGVGPISHPLSKLFVRASLSLAYYRSYRDDESRQYAAALGVKSVRDPVYPDLAFSLPMPMVKPRMAVSSAKPVVALGVLDYHGQFAGTPSRDHAHAVYRRYLREVVRFTEWLITRGFSVRLVLGDVTYDPAVQADIEQAVSARGIGRQGEQVVIRPIQTVQDLVVQLAESDIVVSSRFHNVVLSLLLNKPVIALGYQSKFNALMSAFGLGEYCLNIDEYDSTTLAAAVLAATERGSQLAASIAAGVHECRMTLEEQYRRVFSKISVN